MMNKPNILFVSSTPHIAGGETNLFALLNTIDVSKFGIYCLYHADSHFEKYKFVSDIHLQPFHPPVFHSLKEKCHFFLFLVRLYFFLLKYKIKLVYINTPGDFKYFFLLTKILKIPVIIHIHLDEDDESLRWIKADQAHALLFPSKATISSVLSHSPWIPVKKCFYVHNAVQPDIFFPREVCHLRRELRVPEGLPVVGLVGQLKRIKGQYLFIEAAHVLLKQGVHAYFLIVGDDNIKNGEYLAFLQQEVSRLQLTENISFLGYRTDIPDIMSFCDLIAVPSLREPFGRVVIEAMACGTPVVASAVGGIVEIFKDGEGGLFCEPGNALDLAEKIQFFFDNPGWWQEQKKRAVINVEKNFTQNRHTGEIEKHITRILGEHSK